MYNGSGIYNGAEIEEFLFEQDNLEFEQNPFYNSYHTLNFKQNSTYKNFSIFNGLTVQCKSSSAMISNSSDPWYIGVNQIVIARTQKKIIKNTVAQIIGCAIHAPNIYAVKMSIEKKTINGVDYTCLIYPNGMNYYSSSDWYDFGQGIMFF